MPCSRRRRFQDRSVANCNHPVKTEQRRQGSASPPRQFRPERDLVSRQCIKVGRAQIRKRRRRNQRQRAFQLRQIDMELRVGLSLVFVGGVFIDIRRKVKLRASRSRRHRIEARRDSRRDWRNQVGYLCNRRRCRIQRQLSGRIHGVERTRPFYQEASGRADFQLLQRDCRVCIAQSGDERTQFLPRRYRVFDVQ